MEEDIPELIEVDNYQFVVPAIPAGANYLLAGSDTGILNHKMIHTFETIQLTDVDPDYL